jgi:hypothetical protein
MTNLLIFFAIFNIAGFTALPLLCSKNNPLTWILPMPGLHRLFLLTELVLVFMATRTRGINDINVLFFLAAQICILNLVFNFRYIFQKIWERQSFVLPTIPRISSELKIAKGYRFEMDGKIDSDIYILEDSRIMTDLVMSILIFSVII